jgi:hypothetical protein
MWYLSGSTPGCNKHHHPSRMNPLYTSTGSDFAEPDNVSVFPIELTSNYRYTVKTNRLKHKGGFSVSQHSQNSDRRTKLHGSIVVDGVLASCHSSFALDGLFSLLGVPIAHGYQLVFVPIRVLYRFLGPVRMASMEFIIDAVAEAINTTGISWISPLLGNLATIVVCLFAARTVGSKIAA